jgi:curli production assembly/transport component CsgG
MIRIISLLLLTLFLGSCASTKSDFDVRTQTVSYKGLTEINSPKGEPVVIAVYDFVDMTGQKKPGGNFASMSTAVTQGSYQLLIKALQDAGEGKWFRVVERASLPSLLQERKLIRSTRQQVNGEGAEPLPPLLFAGAYITGGIVGYDSDTKSGGVGARILGIQAHKQYRQDVVTIILRLINVQSGEVVITTTVEKTILSGETGADVFKYLDTDTMLLEVEVGVARNEPVTYAVRKAIEKGVVDLINEGAKKGLWEIDVPVVPEIKDYVEDGHALDNYDGEKTPITVEIGEEKVEKTYEDFLKQKEEEKEARKRDLKIKLECEKNANATGKVSEKCTDMVDERDWEEVDKATEETKIKENADETNNDSDSDSSSDTN